jgi:hypothetical protein
VYFERYPDLRLDELARFVDARERSTLGPCETHAAGPDQENDQGLRVGAFVVSVGGMNVATLVHSVPSPNAAVIDHSGLSAEVKQHLSAHGAFALLTQLGGEELRPVERVLFLYKVAAGMCHQGGIGVANLCMDGVFPGGLLQDLFGKPLPGTAVPVWEELRTHGEPAEMLVRYGWVELAGRRFLATRGYAHCGVPDLVWEFTDRQEAQAVSQVFRNCFTYMMEKGPVLKAGHTMGYDKNVAFRFERLPAGLEIPYPTGAVLLVRKG